MDITTLTQAEKDALYARLKAERKAAREAGSPARKEIFALVRGGYNHAKFLEEARNAIRKVAVANGIQAKNRKPGGGRPRKNTAQVAA